MHWVTCFKVSGFLKNVFAVLHLFSKRTTVRCLKIIAWKYVVDVLYKSLQKNAIFSKVTVCRTYATSQKISSFTVIFKDFSADFTTNSLERAVPGKSTSLECFQWLFVPLLLPLLFHLTFTCPKLAR